MPQADEPVDNSLAHTKIVPPPAPAPDAESQYPTVLTGPPLPAGETPTLAGPTFAGPGPAVTPAGGHHVGRYEVLAELGKGGMGVVYRARDTVLGREVAIKMILAPSLTTQDQVKR